jgi:hypothetical protein
MHKPSWFDLHSPHARMVHEALMNPPDGHFDVGLAHAINDESEKRYAENERWRVGDSIDQAPNLVGFDQSFQDIHTGEPMDLAWRLLKYEPRDFRRQRRRGVRPRDMVPPNPFPQPKPEPAPEPAAEAPAAGGPVEEALAWGDPEGEPGHLEDRMEERFPDMQDEIRERITTAMNEEGRNISRDPHLQTNQHAIVTHAFDSPQQGGDTHAIARIRGTRHPDFEGKLTPTVTTVHGINSRGDLKGALREQFISMIDATGPKVTWHHLGRKRKSYYVKVLDQLLKDNTYQTTLGSFMGHDSDPNTPIMAIRGMSPDRADRAMLEGLGPSPKYPVDGKPVVWSVGGGGARSRRFATDFGPSLIGIKRGAMSGIPHEISPEGLPIYANRAPIAAEDLVRLMLKHAKSPEAKKNKQKYDKDYHSSPSRVKYRVDLKRERRKRGIYGKGGKDMSHTKNGGLVAEASSTNRARQGSNGHSTKKASPFDLAWSLLKNVVPMGEDVDAYERAVQQAIAAANVDTTRGRGGPISQHYGNLGEGGTAFAPISGFPQQPEVFSEDDEYASRTGGLRPTPERRFRNIHGQMEQAAANTAGGLQGGQDVPLTVGQAEALDLASHQRIGQPGNYAGSWRHTWKHGGPAHDEWMNTRPDGRFGTPIPGETKSDWYKRKPKPVVASSHFQPTGRQEGDITPTYPDPPRPEASMPDPSIVESEEADERFADLPPSPPQELPSFSGDAPMGQIADVYQPGVPHIENRPPSPGPETSPFPPPPLHDRPVAIRPRAKPKSAEQIQAEIDARMAQEKEASAPDVPVTPQPEPQPYVNPRKVGVRRQSGPVRGTPRRLRRDE